MLPIVTVRIKQSKSKKTQTKTLTVNSTRIGILLIALVTPMVAMAIPLGYALAKSIIK
ncbi:MAG: hypothetical protein U0796_17890 [Gemmatales bacterium]